MTARVQASVLNSFSSQHEEPPVEGLLASALLTHLHYPLATSRKNSFLCECLYKACMFYHLPCTIYVVSLLNDKKLKKHDSWRSGYQTEKLELLSLYLCRRISVLPQRNGEQLPVPICGKNFIWMRIWSVVYILEFRGIAIMSCPEVANEPFLHWWVYVALVSNNCSNILVPTGK